MKRTIYSLMILLLAFVPSAWAQQQPNDPIGENFIPPELIMQHQQQIGLSQEQRGLINAEIQRAQSKFTELQWQLASEVEAMASIVKQERLDEGQTLAQLDKILNLEREIKRAHFTLIVRLKNALTVEQQTRLQEIKRKIQNK
jgi:Spy/CpxP family protein refolding chaperone